MSVYPLRQERLSPAIQAVSDALVAAGGGLSRRWGLQARRPLLGQAWNYSLASLRASVKKAAGRRLREIRWASTLFPDGLWRIRAPIPLGDVIGIAAVLTAPWTCPRERISGTEAS